MFASPILLPIAAPQAAPGPSAVPGQAADAFEQLLAAFTGLGEGAPVEEASLETPAADS